MKSTIDRKKTLPASPGDENSRVLENKSLFLETFQAIPQLAEFISRYENNIVLMIVLCQDVMPVANEIAGELGLKVIFSPVDFNTKAESEDKGKDIRVDFDYDMVKESGRETPQDFILHQEQNLRMNLICFYTKTYDALIKTFPGKLIILVDKLTNIDAAFFPCITETGTYQSGGNSFSPPAVRHFVFLHVSNAKPVESITKGLDIIIEFIE